MMPGGKILLMCCNGLLVMTGAYQAGGLAAGVLEQRIIEQEAAPFILPAVAPETNTKSQVSADYTEFSIGTTATECGVSATRTIASLKFLV